MGKESIIDSLEYDINIRNILCGGGRQLSASILCRFCIHNAASSYRSELGFVRPISPIIQKYRNIWFAGQIQPDQVFRDKYFD